MTLRLSNKACFRLLVLYLSYSSCIEDKYHRIHLFKTIDERPFLAEDCRLAIVRKCPLSATPRIQTIAFDFPGNPPVVNKASYSVNLLTWICPAPDGAVQHSIAPFLYRSMT